MSDESQPARFIPGHVLAGRYRIVELVGQGGMGEVYRAQDMKLGQTVALKFLPAEIARDSGRLDALLAEVRVSRQVTHPNVCRVHDIVETDGVHFLTMEFVDGEDLASLLRRIGRLPADKAVEITREICAGLAAIHDRGLLHRDLKPANVMIDGRGHARITDFGLAAFQSDPVDPEMIIGTPAYMAPESLVGGQLPTPRSDLYSLGLVMYELWAGRRPIEATTLREIIRLRCETPTPRPSGHQRDIDPKVEQLILQLLDKEPERRPRSALAVATALPGGDPLAVAIAAGKTPSPELVAARTAAEEASRPSAAWAGFGALLFGLLLVTAVSPRTRLVPALAIPEPPEAMAGRARALLHELGFSPVPVDHAHGFNYDEQTVDRIASSSRAPTRWASLTSARPPVVTFWYRESPAEMVPAAPAYRVTYSDPPMILPGMVGVRFDPRGFLVRLDAPALSSAAASTLDSDALFRAAGLELTDFHRRSNTTAAIDAPDLRMTFDGHDRANPPHPVRVELVAFRGRPVSFAVEESGTVPEGASRSDPSGRVASVVLHVVRPALMLAALFVGVWIARRNLRAGRGDTTRALRVAGGMLALRFLIWLLGGHHTAGSATDQIMSTVAWGLYDFAYGWIVYVAIEPYVRRLWPRVLTSWVRLLDGQHHDPRVGRDLLIGCLLGTAIALAVAGHQAAPALFGAPPGRPDNVGYVDAQLMSMTGFSHQVGEILRHVRSNLVLVMGFVVILVMARITLRNAKAAVVAAFLIFVPLALPKGELMALNLGFAVATTLLLMLVLMRVGLLAAAVGLLTYATLQSAPLGMGLGSWPTGSTVLPLALVLGIGAYGFVRSQGGRSAFRDVLTES